MKNKLKRIVLKNVSCFRLFFVCFKYLHQLGYNYVSGIVVRYFKLWNMFRKKELNLLTSHFLDISILDYYFFFNYDTLIIVQTNITQSLSFS